MPRVLWPALALALAALPLAPAPACAPAFPPGKPVVNADQTVIILWDAARKTQHFIRKASFQGEPDDFGFLIPAPSKPDMAESGNDAFPALAKLTEPEVVKVRRPFGLGCGASHSLSGSGGPVAASATAPPPVRVLEQKLVAGFNAVVLEADNADALTGWLKKHGYAYSPEVAAWARPYVEAGWKITALKIAKGETKSVTASALRLSFKTDRPLFPYREPDPSKASAALGAKKRLLRIYFLAEARYQGELTRRSPWTGKVVWAGPVAAGQRTKLLDSLKLPATTGPASWWLTEFEDEWPYRAAPADLYFSRGRDQKAVKREPIIEYVSARYPTDVMVYALAALALLPLARLVRRRG